MANDTYVDETAGGRTGIDRLAAQFGHPSGLWGSLTGLAMGIINHVPNRLAIDLLAVQPTDDVLELGFGPGRALHKLSRLACSGSVTGIDRSSAMLEQAAFHNRRAIAEGRVRLLQGTFESLPLDDASVDRILAVNVAYFMSPTGHALAEARRVLRHGGTISVYATDYSRMRRLQFAGPETFQMFDGPSFAAFFRESPFGRDETAIHHFRLPFGFRGIVASITKRDRA